MMTINSQHADSNRKNNFTFLRLLLATLVLVSHSFELIDGNRERELLTSLFHTMSFGELAVDGFFLVSGFLIIQSWQHNPSFFTFCKKRILRIYPAFIVASLLCAVVVGPLGSADLGLYFHQLQLWPLLKSMLLLRIPAVPLHVFAGQPYEFVNGAMWTIGYEMRCYILVALCGVCGVAGRRFLWLIIAAAALALSLVPGIAQPLAAACPALICGDLPALLHFLAFFAAGACFYLFRDQIAYKGHLVAIAAIILLLCMFWMALAQIALVTLGAYILFWFAFRQGAFLERLRTYPDISYGVYLYGWPTQKLLLWYIPTLSPWILLLLACGLSCICGLLSWYLVERPFLRHRTGLRTKD
jgi:peptidoglycan/LPS O-acetylase OafA/YrhL